MKREVYNDLIKWKLSANRKPLIIKGARQIGKTWILKHFGEQEYESVAYINCDNEPLAQNLFIDYDVSRIIRSIEAITKIKVVPGKTLIILDEIQEQPKGLASLKYFCENAREYHVAVAGSLLGIALHSGTSFPVGKVDIIDMYPMSFEEFLIAKNEHILVDALNNKEWGVIDVLHTKYIELLRQYYYVGGMPEVVLAYVQRQNLPEVRMLQRNIIEAYRNDMSKHAPLKEIQRITQVFNSIPAQLAKENKKFIYGMLRKGARASEFEIAIQWLIDAGIVYKINRANNPNVPLTFYEDFNAFKLYILDCGLFGAMNATDPKDVLVGDNAFVEYKGAFTELYVLQQLKTIRQVPIYYYSAENSQIEIDFLIQVKGNVEPIEVKAEVNLRSKSLKTFVAKYNLKKACRTSMMRYCVQDWLVNIPLYAIKSYFN